MSSRHEEKLKHQVGLIRGIADLSRSELVLMSLEFLELKIRAGCELVDFGERFIADSLEYRSKRPAHPVDLVTADPNGIWQEAFRRSYGRLPESVEELFSGPKQAVPRFRFDDQGVWVEEGCEGPPDNAARYTSAPSLVPPTTRQISRRSASADRQSSPARHAAKDDFVERKILLIRYQSAWKTVENKRRGYAELANRCNANWHERSVIDKWLVGKDRPGEDNLIRKELGCLPAMKKFPNSQILMA